MDDLELSVCPDGKRDIVADLQPILDRSGIKCRLVVITWGDLWTELVKVALYRHGVNVSQVGAPSVGDFLAMDALRPFGAREVAAMGGQSAFHSAVWQSAHRVGGQQVWAMPWIADPRVIYFWRDMLEQAGVDEQTAFQTPEQLEQTLSALQEHGFESPWAVPVCYTFASLQNAASWVWSKGGDFVSADGKHVLFNLPNARAGFDAYFALHRYMPAGFEMLNEPQTIDLFTGRQVVAMMGPSGWLAELRQHEEPDTTARLGVALPPGPSMVGGSNLVVWKHTRREREAVELVQALTSRQAQVEYCQRSGHLPARLDALTEPPFSTDPHYRVLIRAVESGRPFTLISLGGLLEDKLMGTLNQIWASIAANPDQELDAIIVQHLEPLAQRLELALSG
jgi:multiple sugar transport system substrate-binding protein